MSTSIKLKEAVIKKLGRDTFKDLMSFISQHNPRLWGEQKPKNFLQTNVILALYKDLFKIGYTRMMKEVKLSFRLHHKSLAHNTKILRALFGLWGRGKIQKGTLTDWKKIGAGAGLTGKLKNVNLWIDSTDVALTGRRTTKKKSPDWSYKCNGPGRRYMCIQDARRRIKKIWGGYSPKIYDSHFIEAYKEDFESTFKGATFLADSHFQLANKFFSNIRFITKWKDSEEERKDPEGRNATKLTKDQKELNQEIKAARARVESPFGFLKNTWVSLSQPWPESKEELDSLVLFGVGVHNFNLKD